MYADSDVWLSIPSYGYGAIVCSIDGRIEILRVESDSPAEKSGLRHGDILVKVDGNNALNLSAEQVGALLR